MRKIVAGLFLSLDGVYEAPHEWHFPYFSDDMGAEVDAQAQASDAMLLGRVTYEEWAGFWPSQGSDVPFADHLNNIQKYVVSNTLTSADWQNSTLINGDVAAELRKLKEQPGKNISISGSGKLIQWLLQEGLLDELRLLVHPIVVGSGKKHLFPESYAQTPLELAEARTIANGVLALTYKPAAT